MRGLAGLVPLDDCSFGMMGTCAVEQSRFLPSGQLSNHDRNLLQSSTENIWWVCLVLRGVFPGGTGNNFLGTCRMRSWLAGKTIEKLE